MLTLTLLLTLLLLQACGSNLDPNARSLATAQGIVDGIETNQCTGYIVASAGDVNGDGRLDLITGTLRPDQYTGAVYLLYGPNTGSLDTSMADVTWTGAAPKDNLGMSVTGVGDMDGDGFGDLIFGARYADGEAGEDVGAIYLVYGPPDPGTRPVDQRELRLEGETSNGRAGRIVDGGSDLTGDGVPDLLTGAPLARRTGVAYVIPGPILEPGTLASAHRLLGEAAADRAGQTVAIAGDVDGDGMADLLVGAQQNDGGGDGSGRVYLVLGPVDAGGELADLAIATVTGEAAGDRLGDLNGAHAAGDLDGDGYQDIVVASKYHDQAGEDAGAVYLLDGPLSGALSAADADGKWVGEQAGDLAGYHATSAGDINGDGLDDVVIGAAEADLLAVDSGAVYVLYGPATGHGSLADAPVRLSGEDADDRAGQSVASAGDVDGDGLDDIFVGANGRNDKTGRIYFLAGSQL